MRGKKLSASSGVRFVGGVESTRHDRLLFAKHFERAQGWLLLDRPVKALAALDLIPAAFQDRTEVWVVRGHAHQAAAHWAQAEKLFGELVKRDANDAQHWISLAYAVRRAKSIHAAEPILVEARRRFPREALIAFNLACYAAQLGREADARGLLATALQLEPELKRLAATDPDLAPLREGKK